MSQAKADPWLTTEEISAEVGVSKATLWRWARLGVLPEPTLVHMGRRGRHARWPLHTPEQARWVLGLLERGWTFEEIRAALERGEFAPRTSGSEDSR
ncbi:MAG TPA: helix-turn-helix domain-containing protein [Nannocystis sp.]